MFKQLRANTLQWTIKDATLSVLWSACSYSDNYNYWPSSGAWDDVPSSSMVELGIVHKEPTKLERLLARCSIIRRYYQKYYFCTKRYLHTNGDVIPYATCDEAVQHAATLAYKVGAYSLANALRGQLPVHNTTELVKLFAQLDKEYLSE